MKTKPLLLAFPVLTACQTSIAYACDSRASLQQGMAFANMNDFTSAVHEFRASIKCRKSAKGYSNLGVAYLQLGKNNLALDALKEAESINTKDNVVLYNLAAVYSLLDQTDLSLTYLDKTLERGFNNYDALRFDPDLANLRGEPEFRTTLEKYKIFIQ